MALGAEGADFGDMGVGALVADFADTGETADLADTGETADFADTGETADFADTEETAESKDRAAAAETWADSATRSREDKANVDAFSCMATFSMTGAGWATATPAPRAMTPKAPVMDQNVRGFFMVSNLSLLALLFFSIQHGQGM